MKNPLVSPVALACANLKSMTKEQQFPSKEQLWLGDMVVKLPKIKGLQDVFDYICFNLGTCSEQIKLDFDQISELTGHSVPTIYRAVAWFEVRGILAKKSHGVYWVNILQVFSGDLKKYIKQKIK